MGGLARILKGYGRMTVSDGKSTVKWVWDYARDEPAKEEDMPVGSERWKASERAKWGAGRSPLPRPSPGIGRGRVGGGKIEC